VARLDDELARIGPSECLVSDVDGGAQRGAAADVGAAALGEVIGQRTLVTRRPAWAFAAKAAEAALCKHFGTASLEGFGFGGEPGDNAAVRAAGAIVDYLAETQKSSLAHVDRLARYRVGSTLEIDEATRRSLEIT